MWPVVTYCNYLEIVSTMTFLVSLTGLNMFLFNTVIPYHFILYIMIIHGIIFAALGF